ncbi:MAG: hypothetical protein AB1333_02905 [Patescibacteria group bacterium]
MKGKSGKWIPFYFDACGVFGFIDSRKKWEEFVSSCEKIHVPFERLKLAKGYPDPNPTNEPLRFGFGNGYQSSKIVFGNWVEENNIEVIIEEEEECKK